MRPPHGPCCPGRGRQAGFSQPPPSSPVCQQGVQAACPQGLPILLHFSVSGVRFGQHLLPGTVPASRPPPATAPPGPLLPGCAVPTPRDASARSGLGVPGPSHSRPTFQPHPALPASLVRAGDSIQAHAPPVAGERVPALFGSGHDSVSLLRQGYNTGVGTLACCLSALHGQAVPSTSPGTGARARAEGQPCCVPRSQGGHTGMGQQERPGHTLCSPETFSGGQAGLEETPGPES